MAIQLYLFYLIFIIFYLNLSISNKDVDFNYIFKENYKLDDQNDKNSNNDKTQFEKELLEAINKLTQKKQQYFYHMIMAEGFKEE